MVVEIKWVFTRVSFCICLNLKFLKKKQKKYVAIRLPGSSCLKVGCDTQIVYTCVFYTHSIAISFWSPKYGQEGNSRKMDSDSRISQGTDPCSVVLSPGKGHHHFLPSPPPPIHQHLRVPWGLTLPRPFLCFWARNNPFQLKTQHDLFSSKENITECNTAGFTFPNPALRNANTGGKGRQLVRVWRPIQPLWVSRLCNIDGWLCGWISFFLSAHSPSWREIKNEKLSTHFSILREMCPFLRLARRF